MNFKNLAYITLGLLLPICNSSCSDDDDNGNVIDFERVNVLSVENNYEEDTSQIVINIIVPESEATITYGYALSGTAIAGQDYNFDTEGELAFLAGETTLDVSIPLIDDDDVEGDETIVFEIISRDGAPFNEDTARLTVTIEDNDEFPYVRGLLINNEGPFNSGSGSVYHVDENLETVTPMIYAAANAGSTLGNIVQSIGFTATNAYIVSNNSNRVDVVNKYSFESIATIDNGLINPRYFTTVNNKGYVTCWGDLAVTTDDYLAIINLDTHQVEGTIAMAQGPEQMIANGDFLYVANKGANQVNNKISVINTNTDMLTLEITVGDSPSSLAINGNDLWVLSSGDSGFNSTETAGQVSRINLTTNIISQTIMFETTAHPNYLNIDGGNIYYYLDGEVYSEVLTDFTAPVETSIFSTSFWYNMIVKDNTIYGCNASDFASNGTVEVYSNQGDMLTSINAGVIPNNVYFID